MLVTVNMSSSDTTSEHLKVFDAADDKQPAVCQCENGSDGGWRRTTFAPLADVVVDITSQTQTFNGKIETRHARAAEATTVSCARI